jgi:hypothetical protein
MRSPASMQRSPGSAPVSSTCRPIAPARTPPSGCPPSRRRTLPTTTGTLLDALGPAEGCKRSINSGHASDQLEDALKTGRHESKVARR